MRFDYYAFDVEEYLKKGIQPIFWLDEKLDPTAVYYTLIDPDSGKFSVTRACSDVVRVPVLALATSSVENSDLKHLTHGSLLTSLGLEVGIKFLSQLDLRKPIQRIVVIMAQTCHRLENNRYRAYFGISIETRD